MTYLKEREWRELISLQEDGLLSCYSHIHVIKSAQHQVQQRSDESKMAIIDENIKRKVVQ